MLINWFNFLLTFKDDHLLVGTRQGHLLMYSVLQGNNTESSLSSRCEVHLLRSNKYFAKKPIQQLAVVPEHQILISLSGTRSLTNKTMFPLLIKFIWKYCRQHYFCSRSDDFQFPDNHFHSQIKRSHILLFGCQSI